MNALILLAALSTAQCEGGQCAAAPPIITAPVASVRAVIDRQPVRSTARRVLHHRPLLRLVRAVVPRRRCG